MAYDAYVFIVSLLYTAFIFPLERTLDFLFQMINSVFASPGFSVIVLSCFLNLLTYPAYRYAGKLQEREVLIKKVIQPQIDKIKLESHGHEQHMRVKKLYKRYSYHPVYGMRSSVGILLQLPFLFAAYHMIKNSSFFTATSFWGIQDLAQPDSLFMGINALPFLMTFVNICSSFATVSLTEKEMQRSWFMAIFFLIFLYNAPAALLLYWTTNNIVSLVINYSLMKKHQERSAFLRHDFSRFFDSLNRVAYFRFVKMFLFFIALQSILSSFFGAMVDPKQYLYMLFVNAIFLCYVLVIRYEKKCRMVFFVDFLFLLLPFVVSFLIHNDLFAGSFLLECFDVVGKKNLVLLLSLITFIGGNLLLFRLKEDASQYTESKKRMLTSFFLPFLIVLFPLLFHVSHNMEYFSVGTFVFYVFLMLSCMLMFFFIFSRIRRGLSFEVSGLLFSAFFFSLLFLPTAQWALRCYGFPSFVFILLIAVMMLLVPVVIRFKSLVVLVFLAVNLYSAYTLWVMDGWLMRDSYLYSPQKQNFSIAKENRKNVYFLVFDSIPDIKTLGKLGVDSSRLQSILNKANFKVYEDTYSLEGSSRLSMSITYEIANGKGYSVNERLKWCAGGSKAFRIFKDNGYKTCSIQGIYMTGNRILTDAYYPPKGRYTSDLDSMFTLVRGVLSGEFKFETFGLVKDEEDEFHRFLRDEMSKKQDPWFVAMHTDSPGHAQTSGRLRENETELYVERLTKALGYMEDDVENVVRNNPEAVIVILSDHGPFLKGGITGEGDKVDELTIRDVYGTLIAIRWPDKKRAEKYDTRLIVNQDIFPVIFAYLADSPEPLELMVKEKKVRLNGHIFLDNGRFSPIK